MSSFLASLVAALVAVGLATEPAPAATAVTDGAPLTIGEAAPRDAASPLPPLAVTSLSGGETRSLLPAASEDDVAVRLASTGRLVLDRGHLDLLAPQLQDGELVMTAKDDTRLHDADIVFRDPADVVSVALEQARQEVPDGIDFLGPEGTVVWILPQTQDPALLWPGWSTEHPSLFGQFDGPITFTLRSVSGPGNLVMFQAVGFGDYRVVASTREGLPASWTEPVPAHVHVSWAFDAPGDYTLTFEASGTLQDGSQVSTGPVPFAFQVRGEPGPAAPGSAGEGDDTAGQDGEGDEATSAGDTAAGGTGGAGSTGALADTGVDDAGFLAAAAISALLLSFALIGSPRRRRPRVESGA